MSWLMSWVLAGVMISSSSSAPTKIVAPVSQPAASPVATKPAVDDSERFDQTYPLSNGGKVAVSNINGSITIDTWDRNEVKVEAVKTADQKEYLADISINVEARADSVRIETELGKGRTWKNYGRMSVDYKIMVPRGAALDEIETVNGSVSIANVTNVTKASAVNGQVKAVNLGGAADLSTVNGTVDASFDSLQPGGRINLETVNGTVLLTLPSDSNATIKADTVNGKIVNDFGLPVRKGQYVGRDLYGRLGSGEARINLSSVNGELTIKRRNDGKNWSPAVDLLNKKDADDDGDVAGLVDTAKMNREVAKAMRESEKEVAKAMADSRKEMEQAQQELAAARDEMSKIDKTEFPAAAELAVKAGAVALAQLSEANFFPVAPVAETNGDTFTVNGKPTVNIDARNCAVSVRGWDRSEVKYSVTRISRRRDAKPLDMTVDHSESKVTIRIASPKSDDELTNDLDRVSVEVFVPRKTDLRVATERQLRVENVSGEIDLKGFGESIDVRDSDGKLRVAAANGRVRVIGFKGEVESENADGEVNLEGDFTRLNARTADGNIIVTLPDDASATIRSTAAVDFVGIQTTPGAKAANDPTESWKIGSGNAAINFSATEGRFMVRSAGSLRAAK